jgi:hypothetical protein
MSVHSFLESAVILGLHIVVSEGILVSGGAIYIEVKFFILEKFGSFYAVDTHIMLNSWLGVEFVLFLLEIFFVDGHPSLAGHLELDVFWLALVFCTH